MRYLICYDIVNNKRLNRVHKLLLRYGLPLQYSVFIVESEPVHFQQIWQQIERQIEVTEDDIRAYPIRRFDLNQWHKAHLCQVSERSVIVL